MVTCQIENARDRRGVVSDVVYLHSAHTPTHESPIVLQKLYFDGLLSKGLVVGDENVRLVLMASLVESLDAAVHSVGENELAIGGLGDGGDSDGLLSVGVVLEPSALDDLTAGLILADSIELVRPIPETDGAIEATSNDEVLIGFVILAISHHRRVTLGLVDVLQVLVTLHECHHLRPLSRNHHWLSVPSHHQQFFLVRRKTYLLHHMKRDRVQNSEVFQFTTHPSQIVILYMVVITATYQKSTSSIHRQARNSLTMSTDLQHVRQRQSHFLCSIS